MRSYVQKEHTIVQGQETEDQPATHLGCVKISGQVVCCRPEENDQLEEV